MRAIAVFSPSVYRKTKNARHKSSQKDSVDEITKLINVSLNLNNLSAQKWVSSLRYAFDLLVVVSRIFHGCPQNITDVMNGGSRDNHFTRKNIL